MKQLFSFHGRVTRMRWWATWLVVLVLGPALGYTGTSADASAWAALPALLVALVLGWIGCATSVRRWHDIDRPGWMSLVFFVPVVGPLFVLIFNGFIAGDAWHNRYGSPAPSSPTP